MENKEDYQNIKDFGNNNNSDKLSLFSGKFGQNANFTLSGNTIKGIYKYYTAIGEYKEKTNEIVVEGNADYIGKIANELNNPRSTIILKR